LRFPTTETGQNPKLVAPGLQKPTAGAGARVENDRLAAATGQCARQ
jgi:hypothetical protein